MWANEYFMWLGCSMQCLSDTTDEKKLCSSLGFSPQALNRMGRSVFFSNEHLQTEKNTPKWTWNINHFSHGSQIWNRMNYEIVTVHFSSTLSRKLLEMWMCCSFIPKMSLFSYCSIDFLMSDKFFCLENVIHPKIRH